MKDWTKVLWGPLAGPLCALLILAGPVVMLVLSAEVSQPAAAAEVSPSASSQLLAKPRARIAAKGPRLYVGTLKARTRGFAHFECKAQERPWRFASRGFPVIVKAAECHAWGIRTAAEGGMCNVNAPVARSTGQCEFYFRFVDLTIPIWEPVAYKMIECTGDLFVWTGRTAGGKPYVREEMVANSGHCERDSDDDYSA
jgi:hypothetical protein